MRKIALALAAVILAACFSMSDADAAKKRRAAAKAPVDAVHEWNKKNVPAMAAPAAAAKKAVKKKSKKKKAKKK